MSSSPFWRQARVAAGTSGAHKSTVRQRQEMLQLHARCILTPAEYKLYRFYERDKDYRYMLNFLTVNALRHQVRPALNDPNWKAVLDNKWLFHVHYQQFGLPLPELYGLYEPGVGFTPTGKPLAAREDLLALLHERRPAALVVKPLGGIMGKQVLILRELHYEGEQITAVTNTGQSFTLAALTDLLDRPPEVHYYMSGGYKLNHTGYLLQEKLLQHEFLNAIAPYTLNTIRVVTFVDRQQEVDIHFSIVRLGRQGTMVDNWDQGGVSVAVDVATGVLGAGVIKPKHGGQWTEVHPDSGVHFTGQVIPQWAEVVALCVRAARLTPRLRSVGWDVALTPEGPVLIEGNPDWDLAMVQVHTPGLLQPEVRAKLAHFGLTFPENDLPPVSPHAWWVRRREKLGERLWTRSLAKRGRKPAPREPEVPFRR